MPEEAAMRKEDILPMIRDQVKNRLITSQAYKALPRDQRVAIAHDTVKAINFIVGGADGTYQPDSVTLGGDSPIGRALADKPPLPEGDSAGRRFAEGGGAIAAREGSEAFTEMIQQVNFPKFVGGLIDGVFNAIVTSSIKQMEAYAELVKNVSKSVDQYMKDNVSENNARDYLADKYPDLFEVDIEGDKPKLKAREGIDENNMPNLQEELNTKEPVTSLDDSVVEESLVPAARRRIAMDRQQLLATMVMMGVNRLVVTNGLIEATCLFELNTKDEVKRKMNQKRTSDWARLREGEWGGSGSSSRSGSGFLGLGDDTEEKSDWYSKNKYKDTANFNVTTTRSDDSTAKVDMHAKLTGRVNVNFKSDYFPMEKMIDVFQINQIRGKTPAGANTAQSGTEGAAGTVQKAAPAAGAPARRP
jgi:hypothetical protein